MKAIILRRSARTALIVLLLAFALPAHAAGTLLLTPAQDIYPLAEFTTRLHDPDARLTLADARAQFAAGQFQPMPPGRSNFGYVEGAMWFHFFAQNSQVGHTQWLLAIEYALLDHITIHQINPDGSIGERFSGDRTVFGTRDAATRNFTFLTDLAHNAPTEFYIRVASQSSMQVPLVLARPDSYFIELLPVKIGIGLFYGVQIALLLYNLILWLSIRDLNFLWYVLYVATLGMLVLCLNGLAFQYFWPNSPDWGNLAVSLSIAAANLTMLQFTRSFLELRRIIPIVDRILLGFMLLAALPLAGAFVFSYRSIIEYQTVLALVIAPVILVAALMSVRKYAPARHFLLAWSALLAGAMVYAAVSLGMLPQTLLTEFSLQIGSAAEMILLSFALAYRINLLKAENERIQDDARGMLEARVRARTSELDSALQRLEDANRRLQDFSRRDGLTGVFNRRHFDEFAEQACGEAVRRAEPIAVLMVDVDHFKQINDLHGHRAGDDCLRSVALTLKRLARPVGGTLARYGGEEFAAILPNCNLAQAHMLAESMRSEIEKHPIATEAGVLQLTISIGLYGLTAGEPCNAPEMLRRADTALYAAKRGGRNRVEIAAAE